MKTIIAMFVIVSFLMGIFGFLKMIFNKDNFKLFRYYFNQCKYSFLICISSLLLLSLFFLN